MDEDKASRFISSLVKSIQALCNGFVDFSTSIEVVGHIHLNIDRSVKLDYVLTEEVSKSVSEGSTVFSSHSYHSQPPPSVASKSASDTSNSQKSRKDNETDPLGLSALPREVPNTSKSDIHLHGSSRVSESSNSSHSFSGNVGFSRNSDSEKLENSRSSNQVEDSSNKRRKMGPLSQTPSPANKRSRTNDFGPGSRTVVKEAGFEVIEIKEEPEEEPPTFFGSSAPGQDIQTPDFSNVVMESLDRVNQIEQGTDLVGDGGGGDVMTGSQQPVFPVMFHQSDGLSSSSSAPVPGPSSDPQSVASTSGGIPPKSVIAADDDKDCSDPPKLESSSTLPSTPTIQTLTTPSTSSDRPLPSSDQPLTSPSTSSSNVQAPTTSSGSGLAVPSPLASMANRPHIAIPPLSPKFKPEDLPPDTKAEDVSRLTELHILERVPPTEKKKYPSKRCRVCLRRSGYGPGPARKHPKESVYYCPQCPSKPGLCCYPCYYVYHSKLNYWEPDEGEEGSSGTTSRVEDTASTRGGMYSGMSGVDRVLDHVGQSVGYGSTLGLGLSSQTSHAIGQAMQLDSGTLYGGSVIDVETEQEQKYCPVPMYGESVYGPGGQ